MNQNLYIPGIVILLIGVLFSLLTPVFWCYFGDCNRLTCCIPVICNSVLIITGVCLIVFATTI